MSPEAERAAVGPKRPEKRGHLSSGRVFHTPVCVLGERRCSKHRPHAALLSEGGKTDAGCKICLM